MFKMPELPFSIFYLLVLIVLVLIPFQKCFASTNVGGITLVVALSGFLAAIAAVSSVFIARRALEVSEKSLTAMVTPHLELFVKQQPGLAFNFWFFVINKGNGIAENTKIKIHKCIPKNKSVPSECFIVSFFKDKKGINIGPQEKYFLFKLNESQFNLNDNAVASYDFVFHFSYTNILGEPKTQKQNFLYVDPAPY